MHFQLVPVEYLAAKTDVPRRGKLVIVDLSCLTSWGCSSVQKVLLRLSPLQIEELVIIVNSTYDTSTVTLPNLQYRNIGKSNIKLIRTTKSRLWVQSIDWQIIFDERLDFSSNKQHVDTETIWTVELAWMLNLVSQFSIWEWRSCSCSASSLAQGLDENFACDFALVRVDYPVVVVPEDSAVNWADLSHLHKPNRS